jgi:hypothetical protein
MAVHARSDSIQANCTLHNTFEPVTQEAGGPQTCLDVSSKLPEPCVEIAWHSNYGQPVTRFQTQPQVSQSAPSSHG